MSSLLSYNIKDFENTKFKGDGPSGEAGDEN